MFRGDTEATRPVHRGPFRVETRAFCRVPVTLAGMQTGTAKYLTLKAAAERCSLSVKTLRRAIADGRLKAFSPEGVSSVLIVVDDLDAFVESTCVSGLNLDDFLVGV